MLNQTPEPQTTELWLVRHGETDWNREGRYQGQSDIPLNETGLAQARDTASLIAQSGHAFAAIYSSPLSRAYRTAAETSQRLGLPIHVDDRLREINQGSWQGMNYIEIRSRFSELVQSTGVNILNRRAPGGESIAEVAERMAAAADQIAHAHPAQRVLIFSHGLALSSLYCQARGLPMQEVYDHISHNGRMEVIHWPPSSAV
jgi:broad specificity phosphatase PhoE